MRRWYRPIFTYVTALILFQLLAIERSDAAISVYPTFLFLSAPSRAISISVTNSGMTQIEVWVDFRFGYPVTNDTGMVEMKYLDSTDITEPMATGWIHAFPQRFVLGPQEAQTVRIVISPPPALPSGEFWSRMLFHSFSKEEINLKTKPTGGIKSGFKVLSNIDVPFHYRNGRVFTGVSIQNVTTIPEKGVLKVLTDLSRTGNASFWGIYRISLRNTAGHIVLTQDKKIALYKSIHLQSVLDVSTLPPGTYTLEIELTSKRTDVKPEYILHADPVKKNVPVTIS